MRSAYQAALLVVAGVALARSLSVLLFFGRTLLRRRETVATRWGWVELAILLDPILLAASTLLLHPGAAHDPSPSFARVAAAGAGAVLALGGGLFGLWTVRSLPSMGSGHYVLADQPIVDRGPYARVRHPVYLCGIMIWLALPVAYASRAAAAVVALYVLPIYFLYAREEEKLMVEHYGAAYRDYRERVGMFLPRLRPAAPSARRR